MIESRYLKENIENIQRLMAIPALRHVESVNLGRLLRLSKVRQYEDGERIIRENDTDPWLYFLLSGKIRVLKNGEDLGIIDKKGEIFGEMRIIDDQRRSATVLAAGKTICLAVNTDAVDRLSTSDKKAERLDFVILLYRIFAEYMAERLRMTTEELAQAKKEIRRLGGTVSEDGVFF